jgi:hypothetical protein
MLLVLLRLTKAECGVGALLWAMNGKEWGRKRSCPILRFYTGVRPHERINMTKNINFCGSSAENRIAFRSDALLRKRCYHNKDIV